MFLFLECILTIAIDMRPCLPRENTECSQSRLCITNYSCLNHMNIDEYLMTFNSTKVHYHNSSVAEAAVVC